VAWVLWALMGNYIQISIHPKDQQQSDILIAGLSDAGYEGFLEEEHGLHAFIPEALFDQQGLVHLLGIHQVSFSQKLLAAQNWNEEWERNFQPVRIGNFCSVRASFHPAAQGVQHDLIITPKMSFGTGHHATTCLMILAMEELEVQGKLVLDFGTGTGLLAILAEKMGAAQVLAIDNDDSCMANAVDNISENQCHNIALAKRDGLDGLGYFDIILANLNKQTIDENLASMRQHLTSQGVLILSGLLVHQMESMEKKARKNRLDITASKMREDWLCLQLKKNHPNTAS
jgi:ribosomal protein L11 methyltransferase